MVIVTFDFGVNDVELTAPLDLVVDAALEVVVTFDFGAPDVVDCVPELVPFFAEVVDPLEVVLLDEDLVLVMVCAVLPEMMLIVVTFGLAVVEGVGNVALTVWLEVLMVEDPEAVDGVDLIVEANVLAIVLIMVLNVLDTTLIVVETVFSVLVTVGSADLVTFPSIVVVVLLLTMVPLVVVSLGGSDGGVEA